MANPDTCRHNIRTYGIRDDLTSYVYCVSCNTVMDGLKTDRPGEFEYDIDHNVWVFVPEKKKK